MSDIRWTQIDSWHIIAETGVSPTGRWFVKTLCGLARDWDHTFLDRLPGGTEKSCENCLIVLVGEPVADDVLPAPKRRGRPRKA